MGRRSVDGQMIFLPYCRQPDVQKTYRKCTEAAMAKKITGLLTEPFVRDTTFTEAGETIYRDGVVPGFVLRVGKRTKSFALRIDRGRRGRPINIKLGDWVPAR